MAQGSSRVTSHHETRWEVSSQVPERPRAQRGLGRQDWASTSNLGIAEYMCACVCAHVSTCTCVRAHQVRRERRWELERGQSTNNMDGGQQTGHVPDEGFEDIPQDFDEVGGMHDIKGLQVLLVPEREGEMTSEQSLGHAP